MRIANNIMAMNTHRSYTINNNNISKSAEKLSSGYRVNRAGDDAAGLAISEKMRSQIRGLNMASKNSQDGNSMIQTAEGALQEVHSILQRMSELSVQSATGTNQTLDRNALNAEYEQLRSEIDDISSQITFNDMNLFDGTFTSGARYAPTAHADVTPLAAADPSQVSGTYAFTDNGDGTINMKFTDAASNVTDTTINLQDVILGADVDKGVQPKKTFVIDLTTYGLGSYEYKNNGTVVMDDSAIATAVATAANGTATYTAADDRSLRIQVGAKEGEQMTVSIRELTTETLGLVGQDISTQEAASRAISVTRSAINQISKVRAGLGAAQNRLDHKISNLSVSAENLSASESRIRDVDMASEMTQFTKNNILSQAATAMLAQANALPQNVLSLLQ